MLFTKRQRIKRLPEVVDATDWMRIIMSTNEKYGHDGMVMASRENGQSHLAWDYATGDETARW